LVGLPDSSQPRSALDIVLSHHIELNAALPLSVKAPRRKALSWSSLGTWISVAGQVSHLHPVAGAQMRAGRLRVQLASAQITASAPAGIRIGHDGSFTARHTASATSCACVIGPGSPKRAKTLFTRSA
jgi:hypothetical protein